MSEWKHVTGLGGFLIFMFSRTTNVRKELLIQKEKLGEARKAFKEMHNQWYNNQDNRHAEEFRLQMEDSFKVLRGIEGAINTLGFELLYFYIIKILGTGLIMWNASKLISSYIPS